MGLGFSNSLNAEDVAFLDVLTPSRRDEIAKFLHMTHGTYDEIDDAELRNTLLKLQAAGIADGDFDEMLLDTAGSGYRQVSGQPQLSRGNEKGRFQLAPAPSRQVNDEEQDLLELLSLQKEYDFQMSGERRPHNLENQLAQWLATAVNDKVSTASKRITGDGGIRNDPARKNHPDLPALTDEVANDATIKFMLSNLMGNELGEEPTTVTMKNGDRTSLPVEHTNVAFANDPSRGRDVDNRDLGSTSKNSVLRNENDQQRILELLYQGIVNKAEMISQTHGVTAEQLMEEKGMSYKPGQKTWNPDQYSGIMSESGPGDQTGPIMIDSDGGNVTIKLPRIGRVRS